MLWYKPTGGDQNVQLEQEKVLTRSFCPQAHWCRSWCWPARFWLSYRAALQCPAAQALTGLMADQGPS